MITRCGECQNYSKDGVCSARFLRVRPDDEVCQIERDRRVILASILGVEA